MQANAQKISGTSAYGWPNERTSNQPPLLAVDGDISTFTWTTEAFNTQPGNLGLDFGHSVSVNRIRLYKDNDGGGVGGTNAPNIKDLDIYYTTDSTGIPLKDRTFTHVSNMVNGYLGTELMVAANVNANGTVLGDVHSSSVDGWASLSFDPVVATGVAIGFYYPGTYQHYKVYEFEAYTVPEPSTFALLGTCAISLIFVWRRRKA